MDAVGDDLLGGRCVQLCLPAHLPDGLRQALRQRLGERDQWQWHLLEASADSPLVSLAAHCGRTGHPLPSSAAALVGLPGFAGRVFWVTGLDIGRYPAWRRFLREYEAVLRNVRPLDRSLLCLEFRGDESSSALPGDVCLSRRDWKCVVTDLDLLFYAERLVPGARDALARTLSVYLVAELARWDVALAHHLCFQPLHRLVMPHELLADFGRQRGWDSEAQARWENGSCGTFRGRETAHAAFLALHAPPAEIDSIVWHGQVRVLLPFVEHWRRRLIGHFGRVLTVPFRTRFGEEVRELSGLEIGHIEFQLCSNGAAVGQRVRRLLGALRDVRNDLAHLRPVRPACLQRLLDSADEGVLG